MPACFIASPRFVPVHRRYEIASSSPCCSGALDVFSLALLVLLFPALLKVGVLLFVAVGTATAVGSLMNLLMNFFAACYCDAKSACAKSGSTGSYVRTSCGTTSISCGDKNTTPNSLFRHIALQRKTARDSSSTPGTATGEIQLVVAVPGVRCNDLNLTIVDNVLRISGQSKRGADVYRVEERIGLPRDADPETAQANHEDGELTITMQRKVGKRIPVVERGSASTDGTTSEPAARVHEASVQTVEQVVG